MNGPWSSVACPAAARTASPGLLSHLAILLAVPAPGSPAERQSFKGARDAPHPRPVWPAERRIDDFTGAGADVKSRHGRLMSTFTGARASAPASRTWGLVSRPRHECFEWIGQA